MVVATAPVVMVTAPVVMMAAMMAMLRWLHLGLDVLDYLCL